MGDFEIVERHSGSCRSTALMRKATAIFKCDTFPSSSTSTSLTCLNKHLVATEGLKRSHMTAYTNTNQTATISALTPTSAIRQRKNRLRSRDDLGFQSIPVNFNSCCSFLLHFSSSSEKSVQTQKGLLFFCFFYMLRMQEWTTRGIIKNCQGTRRFGHEFKKYFLH